MKIADASLPADVINYINHIVPSPRCRPSPSGSNATVDLATLIHELTHVWQGVQTGPLYMVRALEAQIGAGLKSAFHTGQYDDSAADEVTEAELRTNSGDFGKFDPEEQAMIVESELDLPGSL